MSEREPIVAGLRDPRIGAFAVSALPLWLWTSDGTRVVWANPPGAAIFGGEGPGSLADRDFAQHAAGRQVARLAATLPHDGPPRLERLREFGAPLGQMLTCRCWRDSFDGRPLIVVAAIERAGPSLTPAERMRRLLAGCGKALAAYSPSGALLYATPSARPIAGAADSLDVLGAGALAAQAMTNGHAEGDADGAAISIDRIGADADTILLATLNAPPEPLPPQIDISPIAQAMARAATEDTRGPRKSFTPLATEDPAEQAPAVVERRHPLRFVWQMDADGHFSLGSDEFAEVIGPTIATSIGRRWSDIADELQLDPNGQIARAIASRETWSALVVDWPVEGSAERLPVELSGLPIFDRDRQFRGYRGFGVCRDVPRLTALISARRSALLPDGSGIREEPQIPVPPPAEPRHAAEDAATGFPLARNVVPFRVPPQSETRDQTPAVTENSAFHELAQELSERLQGKPDAPAAAEERPVTRQEAQAESPKPAAGERARADGQVVQDNATRLRPSKPTAAEAARELRQEKLAALMGHGAPPPEHHDAIVSERQAQVSSADQPATSPAVPAESTGPTVRELEAILEAASDGIALLDCDGTILSSNRSAQALFGYPAPEMSGRPLSDLLAPESRPAVRDDFDGLSGGSAGDPVNRGRDVIGLVREGGLIPLFLTISRVSDDGRKFCAVFRDMTPWKKAEEELVNAKLDAERASAAKSEFHATVSHEIRTPLNAIIGFSEVMMKERFGPVGNERYREYLKDINASGSHLVSLVDDLLDLSKIEAGKLELNFAEIDLNELTKECVALMQPQANNRRIIIRTSLSSALRPIKADGRSIRQIVLNLLSNSVKFTGAGGQVIVSTALTDDNEIALRVRDTGVGMSENELKIALEPFRQLGTSARAEMSGTGFSGTGLGLPLTKALAEANRARFQIRSAVSDGTLVEILFPTARAAA
jgi:PAS domain S-box-containing protein